MQEEVEVQGKAGPGGRLDMNHGFVHHIRRNQIARDDYDREVKQAKEKQKKRYTPGPARPKKPDLQVYHPRQRATEKVHTAGALKDEPNDNGTQLFCLDFEADGGEVTSVIVYESSQAQQHLPPVECVKTEKRGSGFLWSPWPGRV
ncbi:hypothetical protein XENTR_v10009540 [Xenopus tropicalis]|nr:hypothetical protein XENTR_v10009540 [Xenopus tropicalis]